MNGFAARFDDSQRAALDALGYRLLELRANDAAGAAADDIEPRLPAAPCSAIVIDGVDARAPLLRGLLAAAAARGAPARHHGNVLRIETGGDGAEWQLALSELRDSPRCKAALWRMLAARRAGGGGR